MHWRPLSLALAALAASSAACTDGAAGPAAAPRAIGAGGESETARSGATTEVELEARVRDLEALLAAERAERGAERERLECELADVRGELVRREDEFLSTLQAVGTLAPQALPPGWVAAQTAQTVPAEPAVPAESGEQAAARTAAAARLRALRSLLAIEEVHGLELLEIGSVCAGATGPVVFRTLDGRGRPAGNLFAERLHLEASRAARTVTIVLESGYELSGGAKTPFAGASDAEGKGGVRRIPLPHVDPAAWLEAVPELFGPKAALETDDDGRFDLHAVRDTVNRLLAADAASGWWQLDDFAGTVAGTFRKVALRRLDRDGKLERLLFADRMRVEALAASAGGAVSGASVCLVLEDGAQVRGDEKAPFLDGVFRIYLPRAKASEWRDAGVPGLADAPRADRSRGDVQLAEPQSADARSER
jgi:hypothetical protein